VERTLGIIKPDSVAAGLIGEIIRIVEREHIRIVAMKMVHLTRGKAQGFYYVHQGKPFFPSLIDFMTSGPVVLMVLEGEHVITRWRDIMGPTNPQDGERGKIRREFGSSIEKNATHGSDSPENANFEIYYFFSGSDILAIDPGKVRKSGSTGS
jgi:nucleoside-diphosphate kinase